MVVDAICDDDLKTIGRAAATRKLLTGGSGIAMGLPQNFGFQPGSSAWTGQSGKAVVFSGSCSTATRGQVETYKSVAPARELTADDVIARKLSLQEIVEWTLRQEKPPLLYSSADPDVVAAGAEEIRPGSKRHRH